MTWNLNIKDKFNKESWLFNVLPVILVFILTLGIRIYWIHEKRSFFIDEMVSYTISTPNSLDADGKIFKGTWDLLNYSSFYGKTYTKKEFLPYLIGVDGGLKTAVEDIKYLHKNTKDVSHPNLYFSILRLWDIGLKDLSYKTLIRHGCYLNLIFFTMSFFIMYKFLQEIFERKSTVIAGLLFAFLNTGSISTTLLIRPYQMEETFFILLSYMFYKFLKEIIKDKNYQIPKKYILPVILSLSLASTTGYYMFLYAIMLIGIAWILALANKNFKLSLTIMLCAIGLFFLNCVIYNSFYVFIYSYHSKPEALSLLSVEKSLTFFYGAFGNTLIYSTLLPLYMWLVFIKWHEHKKIDRAKTGVFLAALLWLIIICHLSIYKAARYITPAYPVISLFLTYISDIRIKYSQLITLLLYSYFTLHPYLNPDSHYSSTTLYFNPSLFYVINSGDGWKKHKDVETIYVDERCLNEICEAWLVPITIQNLEEDQKFMLLKDTKTEPIEARGLTKLFRVGLKRHKNRKKYKLS